MLEILAYQHGVGLTRFPPARDGSPRQTRSPSRSGRARSSSAEGTSAEAGSFFVKRHHKCASFGRKLFISLCRTARFSCGKRIPQRDERNAKCEVISRRIPNSSIQELSCKGKILKKNTAFKEEYAIIPNVTIHLIYSSKTKRAHFMSIKIGINGFGRIGRMRVFPCLPRASARSTWSASAICALPITLPICSSTRYDARPLQG